MSIVTILYLVFGVVEVGLNGYYLAAGTAVRFGRKQHSELPSTASDAQVVAKVRRMFVLGAVSLLGGIIAVWFDVPLALVAVAATLVATIGYEALIFRFWKIYCEFALVCVIFAATIWAVL